MGLGVLCFTGGSPEKMAPLIETYKKHIANAEPVGEFVNDNIAITTSFMCLEDRDEARDCMTHSGNGRQQTLVFHYLDTFPKPPFVPEWPTEIPDPTLEDDREGLPERRGDRRHPDDCAEGVQKWVDVGVDQLIMGPSGSMYPHELLERDGDAVRRRGDPAVRQGPGALDVEVPGRRGGALMGRSHGRGRPRRDPAEHPDLTRRRGRDARGVARGAGSGRRPTPPRSGVTAAPSPTGCASGCTRATGSR